MCTNLFSFTSVGRPHLLVYNVGMVYLEIAIEVSVPLVHIIPHVPELQHGADLSQLHEDCLSVLVEELTEYAQRKHGQNVQVETCSCHFRFCYLFHCDQFGVL